MNCIKSSAETQLCVASRLASASAWGSLNGDPGTSCAIRYFTAALLEAFVVVCVSGQLRGAQSAVSLHNPVSYLAKGNHSSITMNLGVHLCPLEMTPAHQGFVEHLMGGTMGQACRGSVGWTLLLFPGEERMER